MLYVNPINNESCILQVSKPSVELSPAVSVHPPSDPPFSSHVPDILEAKVTQILIRQKVSQKTNHTLHDNLRGDTPCVTQKNLSDWTIVCHGPIKARVLNTPSLVTEFVYLIA